MVSIPFVMLNYVMLSSCNIEVLSGISSLSSMFFLTVTVSIYVCLHFLGVIVLLDV